jgi:uncharacterized protein DUF4019
MSRFGISAFALLMLVTMPASFGQTPPPQSATKAPPTAPPTEPPPSGPTLGDDNDVIEAGKKWLALLDAGKPGAAWDLASKQLQNGVKRDAFIADVRRVRKPLGKLATRKEVKFARAHDLPGAVSGDYAIIEFDARFENGKHLQEQTIWAIEEGDVWRVSGYFYR